MKLDFLKSPVKSGSARLPRGMKLGNDPSDLGSVINADPDHPKGTHPIITHVHVFVNLHKKEKKVEKDLILQLYVRL